MTDLATILSIYEGSNGDATRMLYRDLELLRPMGPIAVNLFRACKCSARAKIYRKGRGYRGDAYARKDWSIKNLATALHDIAQPHGLSWGWAVDEALRERDDPHHHVIYIELPTGQVSFHVGQRYAGPDFAGQWDGVRDSAADRICRYVAMLFRGER